MSETNIPPIEEAWKLAEGLTAMVSVYIGYVQSDKNKAERTADWAEYHRCIGKIEAYKEVLHLINGYTIKGE